MIKRIKPPLIKLTDWEPDEKLQKHCNAALGLQPDGTFRLPPEKYQPPTMRGTDASADSSRAAK